MKVILIIIVLSGNAGGSAVAEFDSWTACFTARNQIEDTYLNNNPFGQPHQAVRAFCAAKNA